MEQRGEGIFLELREQRVAAWADRVRDRPRLLALRDAGARYAADRLRPFDAAFPIARYLLLHALRHALLRQVVLDCGYSSASLRERLYVEWPGKPAAGILLSTAAVALGEARHCSSDPLCAEHVPAEPSDTLHAACCHACLFVSETSCETNNRPLDRAVLVDLTGDGPAFLP